MLPIRSAKCSVQSAVFSVQCSVFSVQCSVFSAGDGSEEVSESLAEAVAKGGLDFTDAKIEVRSHSSKS